MTAHGGGYDSCFTGACIQKQAGISIIAVLLFCVVLMGAIATFIASGGRAAPDKAREIGTEMELFSMVNAVRVMLARCILQYPSGNNGGTFPKYPAGTDVSLDVLECPGAPIGNENLWMGSGGYPIPTGVTDYSVSYTNSSAGVFVTITSAIGSQDPVLAHVSNRFHADNVVRNGAALSVFFVRS